MDEMLISQHLKKVGKIVPKLSIELASNYELFVHFEGEENSTHRRYLDNMFDFHKGKSDVLANNSATIKARLRQEFVDISKLGAMAALKAIEEWGQPKSRITHLIVHSTFGTKMPSVDFEIAKLLGLKPSVKRCMLNHYGCMAAGTMLRLSKDIAENNNGARVLIICTEVMMNQLHVRSHNNMQSSKLFGDGAGAMVVGAKPIKSVERPLFELISDSQTTIPKSEEFIMTELMGGVILNSVNPLFMGSAVSDSIESIVVEAFKPLGITEWNQLFWIVQPGSVKILEGLEKKLCLNPEKLNESRHILKEYGLMASASVIFVMDMMRKNSFSRGLATTGEGLEYGVFLGIGTGITLETIILRSFPINELVSEKIPSRI